MRPAAPVPISDHPLTLDVEAPKSNELLLSFISMLLLSGVYIAYEFVADPRGSHPLGHSLGILGTFLMVMTELLYSIRKRTRILNWAGPVRHWLSFHIFTGLVGPFLVLMHTGLMFRGLAGISMLLTLLVVASGFVGRYLYTALPRAISGAAMSRREILAEAGRIHAELTRFQEQKPDQIRQMVAQFSVRSEHRNPLLTLFGRFYFNWRFRLRLRRGLRQLESLELEGRRQLSKMLNRKRELEMQIEMLETARRTLRYWHILHVPIGLTLFFSVLIHVIATLYFRAGFFR